MESGQRRYRISRRQGEVEIVDVKVNKVKSLSLCHYFLQHYDVVRQLIDTSSIESQGLRTHRHELGLGQRVSACKQSNIMTLTDKFLHQPGDGPFRPAIQSGRYTFIKWRDLCNPHRDPQCLFERRSAG